MSNAVTPLIQTALTLSEARSAQVLATYNAGRQGESWLSWLSMALAVLTLLPGGLNVFIALALGLLWLKGPRPTSAEAVMLKELVTLNRITLDLRHALTVSEGAEARWARWAELYSRVGQAHGAAFEELPITDAQRHLGAKLAAADRLQRLTDAVHAQQAHLARLQRIELPVSLLVVFSAAVAVFVAHYFFGRGSPHAVFLTTLWSGLIVFGVILGFGSKTNEHQTQISALEDQAASLRDLLAASDEHDGLALMQRWTTLRAEQEDELLRWPTILERA